MLYRESTPQLLELLGHDEEPFGVYYSHTKPDDGFAPKPGEVFSREREASGNINWENVGKNFSCIIGNVWLARKKKKPAWISLEQCGCIGGGFYSGIYQPYMEFIPHYVSTGIPGSPMEGEHYLPSPEAMRTFLEDVSPRKAPKPYGILKPLSLFQDDEEPEIIVFFARGEVIGGLAQLACYSTGDHQAVVMPFGAGCTSIMAWPLHYQAKGEERAVVGGMDPSARKYLKTDELTFATPLPLFEKMLQHMQNSFLTRHTWEGVRKKVLKSRRVWGENT